MNTNLLRKMGRTTSLRVMVWMLAILMVAPPPLLAQTLAPTSSMFPTPSTPPPAQPIMTTPSAVQPIAPQQMPCPKPQAEEELLPRGVPAPQATQPGAVQVEAGAGQQPPLGMGWPAGPTGFQGGPQQGLGGSPYLQQGVGAPMYPQQGMGGPMYPQQGLGGPLFTPGATAPFSPFGPGIGQQTLTPGFPSGVTGMGPPGMIGGQFPSSGMGMPLGPTGSLMGPPGMQMERLGAMIQQPGDPLSQISAGLLSQAQPEEVSQPSLEQGFARFFQLQGLTGKLKQFGYNFFDAQFSGLPPMMDVPVGPDYILGPEDTLAIHVWNVPDSNLNRTYVSPVEQDGSISIPQVGSIPIVGATFSQATQIIRARLSNLLKRFEMHLSMARLRTIKVFVVGEVVRPGAYEVSSLATASHALYAACGPAKSGSLRTIRIVRNGKTLSELDFYRFFLQGDRTQDLRLQSGDTVLVPPIGPVAAIGGPVKRPGIYELNGPTPLTDVIDLAGGLTPGAGRKRCQIFRVEAGKQRVILDVELGRLFEAKSGVKADGPSDKIEPAVDPIIQDGDFVRIASVPAQVENAVSLIGAIRDSGPYEFRSGMRLRDLLTPEQMLKDSYWDRAELIRTDQETYETTIIPFSPKRLFQGVEEENKELRRLDRVVVATQVKPPRLVSVQGEVKRPGNYTIESGERLSSVLKRAGGLTPRAFPKGIVMTRDSVRRAQQAEIEKFVLLQKQKLISETASYSAGGSYLGIGGGQELATLQVQLQALDQVAARISPGRVVVKMDSIEQLEGSREDLALEEGDQIMMPQRPQTVTIVGAVRAPVSVVHQEGLRADDYIRLAGGLTGDAEKKEMYILLANGSTDASYVRVKDIGPGDTIVVPQSIEAKTRPIPFWTSMAAVLTGFVSAATAAIAILVIGNR